MKIQTVPKYDFTRSKKLPLYKYTVKTLMINSDEENKTSKLQKLFLIPPQQI